MNAVLLIRLCLAINMSECHDQAIGTADGLSMTACMSRGQQLAATYLAEHPDERLTGYRCSPAGDPRLGRKAA